MTVYRAVGPGFKQAGLRFESGVSKSNVAKMLKESQNRLPCPLDQVKIVTIPSVR